MGEWIPILAISIPLAGVVMGIGTGMLKMVLNSQEKRLEMRLRLKERQDDSVKQQIEALRAEIAALRDTSTQYDVSLDHTLQRLEARVQGLETSRAPYPTVIAAEDEQTQKAGRL